jgi:hypothetical protein
MAVIGVWATVSPTPASAMTVTHTVSSYDSITQWRCPGDNPVEHYTLTARTTTFKVRGERVREHVNVQWRGWITSRDTGELVRDAGSWNEMYFYDGKHLVRSIFTGAVWRFVVPGHGIVVQQTGRAVYEPGTDDWTTPFGASPDYSALCQFV